MQSCVSPLVGTLRAALDDLFGFDSFREGQYEVMAAIEHGKSALVVMPTGAGKSLCYQLPACVIEGIALVVSPLIALMKDQVDFLHAQNIPATFINSSLSWDEQRERIRAMQNGAFKIVYVAPERFRNQRFCAALAKIKVGLLAIDEAHCISQWGHDFRPDYLALGEVRAMLQNPPTVALTATATTAVQRDIVKQLQINDAEIFVSGFARPNLFFDVSVLRNRNDKMRALNDFVQKFQNETMVIYCATRRQVEEVSENFKQQRIVHLKYHAGLSDTDRESIQDAFMNEKTRILIATNAFGMGVDKANVRAIVHYHLPGSIEAYYQEAGRAGRDGKPSHCLLLYHSSDRGLHNWFADNSYPSQKVVESVWQEICARGEGTHTIIPDQLAQSISRSARYQDRVHPLAVEASLRFLERNNLLEWGIQDGIPWARVLAFAPVSKLKIDWQPLLKHRQLEADRLQDMIGYITHAHCRQAYLLNYFHRDPTDKKACNHCDLCHRNSKKRLSSGRLSAKTRAREQTFYPHHEAQTPELPGTYAHTLSLLRRGLSYQQISKQRGLTTSSVLRHVMYLADHGHHFELDSHVNAHTLEQIREISKNWSFGDAIAPLKSQMPQNCSYEVLKLHLAKILMERHSK